MIFLYRRSSRTHQSMQTNYPSNATFNLPTQPVVLKDRKY